MQQLRLQTQNHTYFSLEVKSEFLLFVSYSAKRIGRVKLRAAAGSHLPFFLMHILMLHEHMLLNQHVCVKQECSASCGCVYARVE